MTNRKFAVDTRRRRSPVAAARAKRGTAFVYTLSEAARVVVTVERKNRRKRYARIGTFTQDGAAGRNTKRWLGKIGSKALPPGTYRASVVATDTAGNASAPRRLTFRIVRR
jgi:hypothetical protein